MLLHAFETARPEQPLWGTEDRRWASRVALEEAPADDTPERFLARRATAALRRLGPREPRVTAWLARPTWRARWMLAVLGLGAMLGLAADALGPAHRISLLAPPVWALLLWNALVIVLTLGRGLLALLRPAAPARPAGLRGAVARRLADLSRLRSGSDRTGLFDALTVRWIALSLALAGARAALLLHLGAVGLALGLIASLYLHGLAWDYRVGWSSTFLEAPAVHRLLSVLFEPASALFGLPLPEVEALAALRVTDLATPATVPRAGDDSAAVWIHLWAGTLLLLVVLPRAVLAALAGLQAAWRARRIALPLDDPCFRELLGQRRREVARPVLLPYAQPVEADRVAALTDLLRQHLGETLTLQVAPVRAYGSEDETALQASVAGSPSLLLPCFDLAATPESEVHGRWLRALMTAAAPGGRPGPDLLVLVEESGFAARFGASAPERLLQRRQAWRALVGSLGLGCLVLHEGRIAASDEASRDALAGLVGLAGTERAA